MMMLMMMMIMMMMMMMLFIMMMKTMMMFKKIMMMMIKPFKQFVGKATGQEVYVFATSTPFVESWHRGILESWCVSVSLDGWS